jgi:uncharacterized protein (TIGR03435 family)
MRVNYVAGFFAFVPGAVFSINLLGQTAVGEDRFDVVSIRPFTPGSGLRGGPLARKGVPGTSDPERISYTGISQETLLTLSYDVYDFQVIGPAWLRTERYDIMANVPAGATKDQFKIMVRNLLKERFNLTLHHEMRETAVYELVVAKNGPKLKPAVEVDNPPVLSAMTTDKDGHPDFPAGSSAMGGKFDNGVLQMAARMFSMVQLAHGLKDWVDRPILDKTGLTGNYDFKLDFSFVGLGGLLGRVAPAEEPTGAPSLFSALQDQLGLKLEPKKDPIDFLVVDHANQTPTEN